ncbi:MalY/PatB family protein [Lederbergia wuyishanensis]|uniref:cysteine-S-conjugate beta-lyase n=1 Tax=Lederbergia wuyishanensis TaxID=1347903 RepID=A0ABU0D968_9BACI|nr:MalY/PatB family protein [Lederbergia wuyishanensis]MCJ8009467.1 pyridoxal phosphate-dependent aminotransferase [Lederbergia wuyishanensis]MDQ0344923.1 cystathionine beta-lyase [Lederbergia wuyishanensis]
MYNFDEKVDRKNTSSVKWDGMKAVFGKNELLPMWVADMDFPPPSEVLETMKQRVDHGVFGYTIIGDTTSKAIINWVSKRHGWDINPSWLMYSHGVVPSIGMAIRAFTEVGDKVMLQSPVYTPFFNMIESNMREVINSPLVLKNGRYEIDFTDFEEKLKSGVKLFLLCSPHNPAGRVWSKEELTKIAELCREYGVIIASDEIHADIVSPPYKHIPICTLDPSYSDFIITFMAPSKTFNLAGLQSSFIVVQNVEMRKKLQDIQKKEGFHTLNTFGIIAMEAAYQYGEKWLEDALDYIKDNIKILKEGIENYLPELKVIEPEGTYLVWVDCRATGLDDKEIRQRLLEKAGLAVNFGNSYGQGGEGFIRINTACPRSIIEEGIERLKLAFQ